MDSPRLAFGSFVYDSGRKTLLKRGSPVAVGQKGLILLETLLAAGGRAVSKAELMDAAWPGIAVEESNLSVQIAALRKCLGTTRQGEDWIATVQRVGYQLIRHGEAEAVPEDHMPETAAAIDGDRPSIAVLPFSNMSSDPEQDYFADGLAEDLITDLSKVPGLLVIASHSSFAYKGKTFDIRQVSRELGARYVVEGNVRRAADQVRVNAKLVDAAANNHVWADRFDGDLRDIFALQDDIVSKIVAALAGAIPAGPPLQSRRATSLEAYDLFVRGRTLVPQASVQNEEGRRLLQAAIELEPDFADAHAWLAASHHFPWAFWSAAMEPHRSLAHASARRAVELDSRNAVAHGILGTVLLYENRHQEAEAELNLALRINPNHADAWIFKADLMVMVGRAVEGVEGSWTARRLNPHPPAFYYWFMGFAQYAAGQYEGAVETLRHPSTYQTGSQRILAASLAQLGRLDEARAEARGFLAANPHFSSAYWALTQPFLREDDRQNFLEGFRKAGLPE